jgi:transcriptional regulator with XRE-family HTH domain
MGRLRKEEIRARIKQAREMAGVSQHDMADLMGVANRALQNWEADQAKAANVPWEHLNDIADVTGTTVRWLLHGDEPELYDGELTERLKTTAAALEKVEAQLATIAKRDIKTEVQQAFDDYAQRLGPQIGKLPPRSKRDPDRPGEDSEAAA